MTLFSGFERFWHWAQAALVLVLAISGFEVHGSLAFFGYAQAVEVHRAAAVLFLALTAFAVFWHAVTGAWRQYVPAGVAQKFNPLQQLAYLAVETVVVPVLAVSGALGDANVHTAAAFALVAFVVVHLYMITTGRRLTAHLEEMLTGRETAEEEQR